MKTTDFLLAVLVLFLLSFTTIKSNAQIQVTSGVDPVEMVEMMLGHDIIFDNVQYYGATSARGSFMEGDSAFSGLSSGIFLTSGAGYVIPGPNDDCSAGVNNNFPGNALITAMTSASTYDAAVIQFDFVLLSDTLKIKFVFSSEEYNEFVFSSFNDAFGFFISGPKPLGGYYSNYNIATIPNSTDIPIGVNTINNGYSPCGEFTTGPCANCEYYYDNTSGLYLEYDGYTTPITTQAIVIPNEVYHMEIVIADVGDHIFDSGLFIEGTCFPDFKYFGFLSEDNPQLSEDVTGTILGDSVFLTVPQGTDVTDLVAAFDMMVCSKAFADSTLQFSGISNLDFSEPVVYTLKGSSEKDWVVIVDILTEVKTPIFSNINIYPNPTSGKFKISDIKGFKVKILNSLGAVIKDYGKINKKEIIVTDLIPGFYFVVLEKDGFTETRKVIVK